MQDKSQLIIYKASAGSGKTYALAKEFLKIIIQNPYDYNKILAVTFTKKATEEMKTRIIEYLSALEKKEKNVEQLRNTIVEEILQDYKIDINNDFDKNVRIALQLILHDYSNFNISTIDSFFQSIIRAFAKELDLPIGMEVELDTASIIDTAVQDMLKEYKSNKDTFSRWMEDFVIDLIDEDKSWKIEMHISKLAKQILSEEYQLLSENNENVFDIETYKNILLELKEIVLNYRKKLNQLVAIVEQKIKQDNLDLSLFYQGNSSIASFIKKTKLYAPETNSYIEKMLVADVECYSKSKATTAAEIAFIETAWNSYVIYFVNDVLQVKEQYETAYYSAEIVLKNMYSLALLEFINHKIKINKAANNQILISDTNRIISLIAAHEEVSFIFEKAATFLKYILIDEFQDTSTLQWKGFAPLLLEMLQNINGIVLIVGDPKQSIYRWRGGKMELMMDGIATDLKYHWQQRKNVLLADNYRSANEIILFNNNFFNTVKDSITLSNPIFKNVLEDVQQNVIKTTTTGFVNCKWLNYAAADDVQLNEVLATIIKVRTTKKYNDIAILVRDNKKGALIANYLQNNQIPVVSAESLLLQNNFKIKILIATLEYVLQPTIAFYCIKLNYLYAQLLQEENVANQLIKNNTNTYFFEDEMPNLSRKKVHLLSSLSITELIFLLIHELGFDIKQDDYVLRFQDIILQHSRKKTNSIQHFLDFWNDQKYKLSIIPPEGLDAVKIYTIHKSKGLQFPVVIIPYADAHWSLKPKTNSLIWLKSNVEPYNKLKSFPVEFTSKMEKSVFADVYKQELDATYIDNINLLYVAFTRAEEQLYILSQLEKSDAKKKQKNEDDLVPQNLSKLLKFVLPKLTLDNIQLIDDEFNYGKFPDKKIEKKQEITIKEMQNNSSYNYKDNLILLHKKEYNEQQIKGTLLHDILAKINAPSQQEKAILSTITDVSTIAYYQNATQNILAVFEKNNWFDKNWQHINERTVFYNAKEIRIDKILLSDQQCIIIDYKTGEKEKKHSAQIKEYMQACSTQFAQPVIGYLLYVDTLELEKIEAE